MTTLGPTWMRSPVWKLDALDLAATDERAVGRAQVLGEETSPLGCGRCASAARLILLPSSIRTCTSRPRPMVVSSVSRVKTCPARLSPVRMVRSAQIDPLGAGGVGQHRRLGRAAHARLDLEPLRLDEARAPRQHRVGRARRDRMVRRHVADSYVSDGRELHGGAAIFRHRGGGDSIVVASNSGRSITSKCTGLARPALHSLAPPSRRVVSSWGQSWEGRRGPAPRSWRGKGGVGHRQELVGAGFVGRSRRATPARCSPSPRGSSPPPAPEICRRATVARTRSARTTASRWGVARTRITNSSPP